MSNGRKTRPAGAAMTATAAFDYRALAAADQAAAREAAARIRVRMSRTAEDIIEIGRDLIAVKAKLGHGYFLRWIEAEFAMSDRTARNFMSVAETFKSETVSDLPPKVLYALAAPSTPEEVRAEVAARTAAGETVTVADVKALKSQPSKAAAHRAMEARLADIQRTADPWALLEAKLAEIRRLEDEANALRRELGESTPRRPRAALPRPSAPAEPPRLLPPAGMARHASLGDGGAEIWVIPATLAGHYHLVCLQPPQGGDTITTRRPIAGEGLGLVEHALGTEGRAFAAVADHPCPPHATNPLDDGPGGLHSRAEAVT